MALFYNHSLFLSLTVFFQPQYSFSELRGFFFWNHILQLHYPTVWKHSYALTWGQIKWQLPPPPMVLRSFSTSRLQCHFHSTLRCHVLSSSCTVQLFVLFFFNKKSSHLSVSFERWEGECPQGDPYAIAFPCMFYQAFLEHSINAKILQVLHPSEYILY